MHDDVLTLLAEAQLAGLRVHADGDRLVVTGPRSARDLACRLGQHKPAILAYLRGACCRLRPVTRPTIGGPKLFCPVCCRRVGGDQPYPWSARP